MITVYHNRRFLEFSCKSDDKIKKLWDSLGPGDLEKVAEVDVDSLDDAFRLTNNIDGLWTENLGVRAFLPEARSTSVGDLLVKSKGTYQSLDGQVKATNERFLIAPIGFVKL